MFNGANLIPNTDVDQDNSISRCLVRMQDP